MKFLKYFTALYCLLVSYACTKNKTDYEAEINTVVTERYEFKEVFSSRQDNFTLHLSALNGILYQGYNEIHVWVTDQNGNKQNNTSDVTFLPIKTNVDGGTGSCPYQYRMSFNQDSLYFNGYAVFTSTSSASGSWRLYMGFQLEGKNYTINQNVTVQEQTNKNLNMTMFNGKDSVDYVIALVSPQKPKVAENNLVAGIYKYDPPTAAAGAFPDHTQYNYSIVKNYTLRLDPRMPEPSMGNHSSLNNVDLTQQKDSLYHGIVNYTMTGNWTLNLILENQNGKILKGTVVPTTFTPGVEGAKSDLFIDILF